MKRAATNPANRRPGRRAETSADSDTRDRIANWSAIPFARLVHYGRKTDDPYRVTIWFVTDGDAIHVIAGRRGSGWARNLKANQRAEVQLGSDRFTGHATIVSDEAARDRVRAAFERKYWYAGPFFCASRIFVGIGLIDQWGIGDTMFRIALHSDPDAESLWAAEALRRAAELKSGKARGLPAEKVLNKARKSRR